ncbi:MAG: hypothetical protein IPP02_13155 [Chitinophagaceae bacterium]|nr:hypothetical protein [Chitinophagaceae bacterium]
MTLPEQTIIAGTIAQNFSARYGDYNSLSIDPQLIISLFGLQACIMQQSWSTRFVIFI